MTRALVLACGNSLRGDDGVAVHIARSLQIGQYDSDLEIHSHIQWTPELAEPVSAAELVIFVDASACIAPGEVRVDPLAPQDAPRNDGSLTHSCNPAELLALAQLLYHKVPERAFIVTVGGQSFEYSDQLSAPVRRAVPIAVNRIKALLSGVSVPCVERAQAAAL